jgi:hypothetical protein
MLHKNILITDNHVINQWTVTNEAGRNALSVTSEDIGKVARQTDNESFWILTDDSPKTWARLDNEAPTPPTPAFDPALKWEEYYELVTFNNAEFSQYALGTNAAVTYAAASAGHPGVIEMVTGTTTTGQAGVLKTSAPQTSGLGNIVFGGGEIVYEALVEIPVLWSAGTQEGFIRAGFMDEISGAPANGAHMQYQASDTRALLFTRSGGTSTIVTGITNITTGWHHIKIVVNAAATSVSMYIDGVLEATSTSNIPTIGVSYGATIQKGVGTTSYAYRVDFFKVGQTFTTPRY